MLKGWRHSNEHYRPIEFLVENFDMGKNVVMSAKAAGIKKLINLGSSHTLSMQRITKEEILSTGQLEPTNRAMGWLSSQSVICANTCVNSMARRSINLFR